MASGIQHLHLRVWHLFVSCFLKVSCLTSKRREGSWLAGWLAGERNGEKRNEQPGQIDEPRGTLGFRVLVMPLLRRNESRDWNFDERNRAARTETDLRISLVPGSQELVPSEDGNKFSGEWRRWDGRCSERRSGTHSSGRRQGGLGTNHRARRAFDSLRCSDPPAATCTASGAFDRLRPPVRRYRPCP